MTSPLGSLQKDYLANNFSLEQIVQNYLSWVSINTYMLLSQWDSKTMKNLVFGVKCSKRGNDVYKSRVESRWRGLNQFTENINFFNPKDRSKNKKTMALFVTLTYDTKRCPLKEAWESIGVEFNEFMAYVRSNFGKVSICRVFESYENGYPHIHCVLLFSEYTFSVIRDSKGQFRVNEKDDISKGWHSHVDVKAMYSLSGGLSYLKKYLLKGVDVETAKANLEKGDSKAVKTLALCWIYRKRAFSVSGSFRKALTDLITKLHNSKKRKVQTTLDGGEVPKSKRVLLGFVSGNDIKIQNNEWFLLLSSEQIGLANEILKDSYQRMSFTPVDWLDWDKEHWLNKKEIV